jgi:hypothetical protein
LSPLDNGEVQVVGKIGPLKYPWWTNLKCVSLLFVNKVFLNPTHTLVYCITFAGQTGITFLTRDDALCSEQRNHTFVSLASRSWNIQTKKKNCHFTLAMFLEALKHRRELIGAEREFIALHRGTVGLI